jgi:hypothetical protein
MRSKLAEELKRDQRERFARMTPTELLECTERLRSEGLADYMSSRGVDFETAVRAIKLTRRLGRRPSRCLDERH